METRYPIRKADGTEYQHYREIVNLLGNTDGQWLVANNFLWHGGIHINRNSAPLSVLEEGHPERAIPLQCMATGDVVALRVNERYKEAPYGDDQKIAYSSTFALVRSIHKPDPNKQSSWLTFYTLYMHLAALSDYPKSKFATIIEPTGLKLRRVTGHETEGQVADPDPTDGSFAVGTHVEVGRSMSFKLNDVTRLFCVVRKLDSSGQPQGRPFWVAAGEDNLRTESEQYAYLPDWMQEAVRTSTFDSVIVPARPIPIAAGKSVGYLGRDDVPDKWDNVKIDWQTHIEVFSNDSNMPRFLSNPENIESREKGWIKAKAEATMYQRRDVENVTTFEPTDKKVSADDTWQVVEPEQTTPCEIEGKWWFRYQSEPDYWLAQDGVDEINPHNLIGRNFKPFEQPATGDVEKTLVEPWVSKALRWFGSTQKHDEGSLFPSPWEATAKTIDMYGDHAIENFMFKHLKGLILSRLHNISEGIPELRRRLIVKHESEWHGDSETPRWKKVLQECSDKERPWLTQWRDDMEWMSQVDGFKDDAQKMVWHFHPLEFLAGISSHDDDMDIKWLTVPKGQLTFDAEGNDDNNSLYFSRHIHWPGSVSGVTIGRGYDLGQQSDPLSDLNSINLGEPLKTWLVGSKGLSGLAAKSRTLSAANNVSKYDITRKQQYDLFIMTYNRLEADVKRICQKKETIEAYHSNPNATPEQAWNDIPEKIKEVLVDLRYRGDYTPRSRSLIQRFAYAGDSSSFSNVLSDRTKWSNVPEDRFLRRVSFYEN